jgi:hypothetical protein
VVGPGVKHTTLTKIEGAVVQKPSIHVRARIVGALFIIATIAYASGATIIEPLLGKSDGVNALSIGAFLELIDVIAVIGIGVLLFPILKSHNARIAQTYLGTRLFEAGFLAVSIVSAFLASVLWYENAFQIAMTILGLGSLPFCYLLYTAKLAPKLMSLLGFVGYVALFSWGLLEITNMGAPTTLFIPGALFEIAFPLWLIAKGFNKAA